MSHLTGEEKAKRRQGFLIGVGLLIILIAILAVSG